MIPVLALLAQVSDPGARFDAFMKARPNFVAVVDAVAGDRTIAHGTLRVVRPHRLRFDVKGTGFDYTVVSTESQYLEVERNERVYDEHASNGGLRIYDSRISGAPGFLPAFLLAGSTARLFGDLKTTVKGDEIHGHMEGPMGLVDLTLTVNPQGQPLSFASRTSDGFHVWKVVSIQAAKDDPAAFHLTAPLGFVPHALPDLPFPLAIGENAPLTGWTKGGRPVDLNEPDRGRPRLLAVLGADCTPSRAARPFLIELGKTMPVFLIGPGDITDPTGQNLKRLSPPGTPMFYLVGPDGTVKKLWFGFDPAKGAAWETDVKAAAAEATKG